MEADGDIAQWLTLSVWRQENGTHKWWQNRLSPSSFAGRLGASCGYLRGDYSYVDPTNRAQKIVQEALMTIRYQQRRAPSGLHHC